MKNEMITKVSGTGWLCVLIESKWVPMFKLTAEQLSEMKTVV